MYAVIEIGGKQYRVSKNDHIDVNIDRTTKPGTAIDVKKVLLVKDGVSVHVGNPTVKGAVVACTAAGLIKTAKVIAYKYKRRKSSKKKIGHRQHLIRLIVKEITIGK